MINLIIRKKNLLETYPTINSDTFQDINYKYQISKI